MRKPTIKRGPASQYEGPHETIREIAGNGGAGCLLSLLRKDDGGLRIDVYRADPGVEVVVGKDATGQIVSRPPPPFATLIAQAVEREYDAIVRRETYDEPSEAEIAAIVTAGVAPLLDALDLALAWVEASTGDGIPQRRSGLVDAFDDDPEQIAAHVRSVLGEDGESHEGKVSIRTALSACVRKLGEMDCGPEWRQGCIALGEGDPEEGEED